MRKSPVLCFLFLILSVVFFSCTEAGYLVSYESDYDILPEDFSTPKNTILTEKELPELTASGFIFEGWFDGTQKAIPDEYEVISDVTLTAKWTPVSNNNNSDNNDSDDDNKKGSDDSPDNLESKPELVDPELSDSLVKYTVEHYLQNINDDNYSLVASDTQNLTGKPGEKTSAKANTYTGFKVKPITQETISQYGTTVAKVYYDRLLYTITFDTDGGSNIPPITARYGADISKLPVPVKDGFVFSKWQELSGTLGTKLEDDIKCIAIWKEGGSASTDDDGDDDGPNGIKRVGPVLNAEVKCIAPEEVSITWKNPDDDNFAKTIIKVLHYNCDYNPEYDGYPWYDVYDKDSNKNEEMEIEFSDPNLWINGHFQFITYDAEGNEGSVTHVFVNPYAYYKGEPEQGQYAGQIVSEKIEIDNKELEKTGEVIVVPKGVKIYTYRWKSNTGINYPIITPYSIGQYEVTCELFEKIMGYIPESEFRYGEESLNPVSNVSWCEAIEFCNRLSIKKGLDCVYSCDGETDPDKWPDYPVDQNETSKFFTDISIDISKNGYRLPTNVENACAFFAGKAENFCDYVIGLYSGGNYRLSSFNFAFFNENKDDYAWCKRNSDDKSHPVGEKLPNEIGIYDMAGNVSEWLNDVSSNWTVTEDMFSFTKKETIQVRKSNTTVNNYENCWVIGKENTSQNKRCWQASNFEDRNNFASNDIIIYDYIFTKYASLGFRLARTIK